MTTLVPQTQRLEGLTYQTPAGESLELRHCRGFAEYDACVELQRQTWGYDDSDLMPRKGFLLAQELGGQVIGAFTPAGVLVAFAMAMVAVDRGLVLSEPYLHSHMLAVRPEYRNSGLGRRMKLVQREDALARGFSLMTWTFDPMAAKNAYLNIHKLGVIARRYSPDFYGVSSSRLQAGLPTDRLHAEWWLDSERVRSRVHMLLEEQKNGNAARVGPRERSGSAPSGVLRIGLPAAVDDWKASRAGLAQALSVQQINRDLFTAAFEQGLAVTDFYRDPSGDGVYELSLPTTPLPPRTVHED